MLLQNIFFIFFNFLKTLQNINLELLSVQDYDSLLSIQGISNKQLIDSFTNCCHLLIYLFHCRIDILDQFFIIGIMCQYFPFLGDYFSFLDPLLIIFVHMGNQHDIFDLVIINSTLSDQERTNSFLNAFHLG